MSIFFVKTVGGDLSGKFDRSRSDGKAFIYAQENADPPRPVASVSLESHGDKTNPLDPFKVAQNIVDSMNGIAPKHALGMQLFDPAMLVKQPKWIRGKDGLEIIAFDNLEVSLLNRMRGRERYSAVVQLVDDLPPHLKIEVATRLTDDQNVSRYMKTFEAPPYQPPSVKAAPIIGGEKL